MVRNVWFISAALLMSSTVVHGQAIRVGARRHAAAPTSTAPAPVGMTAISVTNLYGATVVSAVNALSLLTGEAANSATIATVSEPLASSPRASSRRRIAQAPVVPPCVGPSVEITRLHGTAAYRGPLVDCRGRLMFGAITSMATIASPNAANERWTADTAPVASALRRVMTSLRWNVAEPAAVARATAVCPQGHEEFTPITTTAAQPVAPSAPRSARRLRIRPRIHCRRIDVARDVHTHDPLIEVEGRVRVIHPRLLEVLSRVTARWPGRRVEIVSGYRPSTNPHAGTRHAHGRALDFRVVGVAREALRDFLRSIALLGVGYYPHSVFVHVDIRDASEGSARWTDYSEPGERPRYGQWPPRDRDVAREVDHITRSVNEALEDAEQNENSAGENANVPSAGVANPTEAGTVTEAVPSAGPGSR